MRCVNFKEGGVLMQANYNFYWRCSKEMFLSNADGGCAILGIKKPCVGAVFFIYLRVSPFASYLRGFIKILLLSYNVMLNSSLLCHNYSLLSH